MNYFGTDGIRGTIGSSFINEKFFDTLGIALGSYIRRLKKDEDLRIVIGRDTRGSGEALQNSICLGLQKMGVESAFLGIVSTPVVPMMVQETGAAMGVMITASHNPANDNGIKFFNGKGLKLTLEEERLFEKCIRKYQDFNTTQPDLRFKRLDGLDCYLDKIRNTFDIKSLAGIKIVVDTANGATTLSTPPLLKALGADIICLGNTPDGKNINDGYGSEYPERLAEAVIQYNAHLGIAHDGDGDRVVFCDENGSILNGDEVMGMLALDALERGVLGQKTLVTTIQSNMGLDKAISARGGKVERVDVGDRNVLYKILELEGNMGGESSGHFIFSDISNSGDGLVGVMKVLDLMKRSRKTLSELRSVITLFPQVTKNLRVKKKLPLEKLLNLNKAKAVVESKLNGDGRVLIRYSGTEPKIRLLVEGLGSEVDEHFQQIEDALSEDFKDLIVS